MTSKKPFRSALVGEYRFVSRILSNDWELVGQDGVVARLRRIPSTHTSLVSLSDGRRLDLQPAGWGTVVAIGDAEQARIERQSWWGRRWEVTGVGFGYELTSDPMPRRWTLRIGGHPVGRLAGTIWSYNRIVVQNDVAVPVHAVILAWHVIARPWEAAAAPRVLRPRAVPKKTA
jgi:hypothetical protein